MRHTLAIVEHGANAAPASGPEICERSNETPSEFAARAVQGIASASEAGGSLDVMYLTCATSDDERFLCRSIVAAAAFRAAPHRRVTLTFVATPTRVERQNELFALVDVLQRELGGGRFDVTLRFVEPAKKGLRKAPVAIPTTAEAT